MEEGEEEGEREEEEGGEGGKGREGGREGLHHSGDEGTSVRLVEVEGQRDG